MNELKAITEFASESAAREYLAQCEANFSQQVIDLTDTLTADLNLHLIGLSGPTCAGKTTAARLLIHQLEKSGHHVHMISVDDFFLEQPHGKNLINDPNGAEKLDFDSIDALDFPLFCSCLDELMQTGKTRMPRFNIGAGIREGFQDLAVRDNKDIFLIEGIQVVYPEISARLRQYHYRSIFIHPARSLCAGGTVFEPNEIRLLRRLVRDYYFRSSDAAFTFFAWDSVRSNEQKSIFPYAHACDEQLDSLMGYEIGMLRPHLETILQQLPRSSVYCAHADTILQDISTVQVLPSEWLPSHALYREFVPMPELSVSII